MFILPAEAIFSSTSNSRRRINVGLSASNFAVFAWLRIAAVSSRREIKLASAAFLASVALRQQVVRRSHVIGAEKCLDHIDPKRQTNFRFWQRLSMKAPPTHRSVAGLVVNAIGCNSAKHGRELPSSLGSFGVRRRNFPWEIHCFTILAHFANWADRAKQPLPSSFCVERFRAHGQVGFAPTWCVRRESNP